MKYVYAHHSHFKGIGSDFRFLFEFLNEIPPNIQKARGITFGAVLFA